MKRIEQNKTLVIFSANYLPNLGGVEKFTESLSRELEEMDTHVMIVTNNVFHLPHHELLSFQSEIYRLPCHSLLKGRLPLPHKNKEFTQTLVNLAHRNIDYVLINTRFYPHSLIGARFAKLKNIVPVIIDHGSDYLTLGNPLIDQSIKLYEHLVTTALKKYPGVYYGISQASLNWLKTFNIEGAGIINNSIDANAFLSHASNRDFRSDLCLSENDFLVCFTGRLTLEKGILPLLECATRFFKAKLPVHFLFAGDGPLKKTIRDKKLPNVHLLGRLGTEEIAALLSQSDVFCLPSRSEGFSTSLLEASACYTPSIVTDIGGASELIPSPDYGVILKEATPNVIENAINSLLTNREKAFRLGQNAGKLVRNHFSWHDSAQKTLIACQEANQKV